MGCVLRDQNGHGQRPHPRHAVFDMPGLEIAVPIKFLALKTGLKLRRDWWIYTSSRSSNRATLASRVSAASRAITALWAWILKMDRTSRPSGSVMTVSASSMSGSESGLPAPPLRKAISSSENRSSHEPAGARPRYAISASGYEHTDEDRRARSEPLGEDPAKPGSLPPTPLDWAILSDGSSPYRYGVIIGRGAPLVFGTRASSRSGTEPGRLPCH